MTLSLMHTLKITSQEHFTSLSSPFHKVFCIFFLFLFTFSTPTYSQQWSFPEKNSLYNSQPFEQLKIGPWGSVFIRPNERRPQDGLPIFNQLPAGVLVSVGLERAFVSSSKSPKVSHLIILDYEVTIIELARINIFLLSVSKDLEDYNYLRYEAAHNEWTARASIQLKYKERLGWISQPSLFNGWTNLVRNNKRFLSNQGISRFLLRTSDFEGMDYTLNEGQFVKLQNMAREGKIVALHGSLIDSEVVNYIKTNLRGLPISAIDISNAWEGRFLGDNGLMKLIEEWKSLIKSETQLIMTAHNSELFGTKWTYLSFPFYKLIGTRMSILTADLNAWQILGYNKSIQPNSYNSLEDYPLQCEAVFY